MRATLPDAERADEVVLKPFERETIRAKLAAGLREGGVARNARWPQNSSRRRQF